MKKIILNSLVLLFLLSNASVKAQTQITFYTSMGDFVVEMYDTITPVTSGNFISLVQKKFYDGVIFHRVIDNFMIQGGDPTGTGTGGPGYKIQDEFDSSLSNVQKTISMANSGPNTGGSQFFINLVNNTHLDFDKAPFTSKHPVFGIVVSNFSVVQSIGNVPTNSSDRPVTDVVMDSLRVTYAVWTGTNPEKKSIGIRIYPNPVSANSLIRLTSESTKQVTLQLYDQLGRNCGTISKALDMGINFLQLSELTQNSLSPGTYSLTVKDGNAVYREQLLVIP